MRKPVLLLALIPALALAACAQQVTLKNPATGETATCSSWPLADINLWSSFHACLEFYVSEGYWRVRS